MSPRDPALRERVLDHGYVQLIDHLGDDLTPVNAARVSFDKASTWHYRVWKDPLNDDPEGGYRVITEKTLRTGDKRLLHYLAEHGHTSPFRHAVLSFEIYAPLLVMRQWGKYRVGSVWTFADSDDPLEAQNESSRRYITETPQFYIPSRWRGAPKNRKQGSDDLVELPYELDDADEKLRRQIEQAMSYYQGLLDAGVCPEQARLFLPAYALYLRARWTASLHAVIHFLQQRLAEDAQWEIRQYAQAVKHLTYPLFPESLSAFNLAE